MVNEELSNVDAEVTDVELQLDSEKQSLPGHKFQGQTRISTNIGKRLCSELSPLTESVDDVLMNKIQALIESSLATYLPKFIAELRLTIDQSIKSLIAEHFNSFTTEIKEEMDIRERNNTLRGKCEAEVLETYNRRENLRVVGIECETEYEQNEVTETKVLDLAKKIEVTMASSDISIAHRLPTNKPGPKPIIVRFARRIARINMLRNRKKLQEQKINVRMYEDLTTARVRFFNLMKSDTRISKLWTRDGTIYFVWKDDNKTYTINNLYDGGICLEYDIADVEYCFHITRE